MPSNPHKIVTSECRSVLGGARNIMVTYPTAQRVESSFPRKDERFSKLYIELAMLGLRINQAKIYLYLLGCPNSTVRTMSRELGLHRVDVYRTLHELEDFGMIESAIGVPRSYSAITAKTAISALLQTHEQRMQNLRLNSIPIIRRLNEYANSNSNMTSESTVQDRSYRVVTGRKRYYKEVKAVIRDAKTEVLRILSPTGLIRTFTSGMFDEYVKARGRGVSLRMLSQINSQNKHYAKRLSKVVKLRQIDNVHLRFLVADNSISVISAKFDEKSLSLNAIEDSYLLIRDSKMAECFSYFFAQLWANARA